MVGVSLHPSAWASLELTLTRFVVPALRSRMKISDWPFVSLGTRSLAADQKATKRPPALIEGLELDAFASPPPIATLTTVVVRRRRSRMKVCGGAPKAARAPPE